jgi:hypothetical protein
MSKCPYCGEEKLTGGCPHGCGRYPNAGPAYRGLGPKDVATDEKEPWDAIALWDDNCRLRRQIEGLKRDRDDWMLKQLKAQNALDREIAKSPSRENAAWAFVGGMLASSVLFAFLAVLS